MATGTNPYGLRTEYTVDPLGIDERAPRFSWFLDAPEPDQTGRAAQPSAYQVVVGTAPGLRDVWDSGRIFSDNHHLVEYEGSQLTSFTRYYWSVRVWLGDVDSGPADPALADPVLADPRFSDSAWFETGPLSEGDWSGASWIGRAHQPAEPSEPAEPQPAPLLRKEFQVADDVERARLYFCGLGYGEVFLDGERVGSRLLDPAPTNYDATVLFSSYDITTAVRTPGPHAIGAHLGRGRYDEPVTNVWFWEKAPWRDRPKLLALLVLTYADGHTECVISDDSWLASDSPVRFDSLYAGEVFDARERQDGWSTAGFDAAWRPASIMAAPGGQLRSQQLQPIAIERVVAPAEILEPSERTLIFDVGEQIAGWARMTFSGREGAEVRIRYGERLRDEDGLVDIAQVHIQGDIQTDTYILRGFDDVYEPRFSYKGFQYVEVTGDVDVSDFAGVVVHSAVESTASLETSDEDLNRLHDGSRRALLNNLHGIPTDTPVFEKNGWTGDAHLTAEMAAFNFDMARFWTKWLQDWADAQKPSGEFPPIVPTSGWGYRGTDSGIIAPIPAWDVAYFEIPWAMYRYYGDTRVLQQHYDGQRRYLDHLFSGFVDDGVVLVGLGDYLPPGTNGIPPEGPGVYETAYTQRILSLARAIAEVLGRDEDFLSYEQKMRQIGSGFNRVFFDKATATYHGENPTDYRQSANAIALAFDLVPEEYRTKVLDNLVADIHAREDHLNTGVIGTKFLLPVLSGNGLVDLAYKVAMSRTYPGYGHWLELGSTTLYEMWQADSRSRNHHFFGHIDKWFVEDLVGVSPSGPGYSKVRIKPNPPSALTSAKLALDTVSGRIEVSWKRNPDGELDLSYELPSGVVAVL